MAMSSAETHAIGRKALAGAYEQLHGHAPNLAELQILGAQSHLESYYGRSPYTNKITGEKRVINNMGAEQCGHPPPCGGNCFEATDTHADGSAYQACFKVYADGDPAAALSFVKAMTTKRPTSWEYMKVGDIDAWAQAAGARDPQTGIGVYFEQPWPERAKGIELRVNEIAQAFGEPVAAKRGGPVATPSVVTLPTAEWIESKPWVKPVAGITIGAALVAVLHWLFGGR